MRCLFWLIFFVSFVHAQNPSISNKKAPRTIHILSYNTVFSKHYKGFKIKYSEFSDTEEDFIIPTVFSFNNYQLKPNLLKSKGYKSFNQFLLGAGLDGFIKFYKGIYVGVGINVPFGYETTRGLNNEKKSKLLIGLESKQGIRLIPWEELGIVLGINYKQHFINSNVLNKEFNLELELGVNF
ncbi:hypothetical protein MHM83_02335 [Tenacibaculum sp. Mcav3-52]|uniref:Uncharacterized protein n=1 Tax=Tenacibaculum mesophilum TaxID=104268 RepID=A0ABM7CGZ7_9FLAO|nr:MULTISPECIES: hypothetical protein [Tenacibaculum]GFD91353.1 hypothetical protein KUL154_00860 [Alteromonas sp. KUL154]GFE01938.1 hypothetical protein KUL156_45300 [Alteromonas sp. KUL156]AZJ33079.1 hypothetical protein D6200_11145 [Tenacibaculum mesophilum]KAF9659284.1 hypothetical protein HBA12_03285 [Tenacibaculum mesophilum]MCG7500699.1 hypothetical protein [Tenacibaculum sp. Mcav3-52]